MKKVFALLIATIMTITTLTTSSFSTFAATKADVPEAKLDEALDITVKPLDNSEFQEITDLSELDNKDLWSVKYTPETTGWYEFVFDTEYKCSPIEDKDAGFSFAMCFTVLVDDKNNDCAMGYSYNSQNSEEGSEDIFGMAATPAPSVTAELTAGKTYYLLAMNVSASDYTSKLTVKNHTHEMIAASEKASVSYYFGVGDIDSTEGYVGRACSCEYCEYKEADITYPAVKSIKIKDVVYNGKKQTPKVTIKLTNGKALSSDNYKVKYYTNKKIGYATADVTFKGNYTGSALLQFKILPKKTALVSAKGAKKSANLKWKKKAGVTGYQIQYSTNKNFKNAKKVNVKGAKKVTKTIKKLKAGKKYYFRIRTCKKAYGEKFYSKWSKVKTAKIKK